jgi:hypothetical protein
LQKEKEISVIHFFYNTILKLHFDAVPSEPERPVVSDVKEYSLVLSWNPPLEYNNRISHYRIMYRIGIRSTYDKEITVSNCPTHRVRDLLPGRAYQFIVAGINEIGIGAFSKPSKQQYTQPAG